MVVLVPIQTASDDALRNIVRAQGARTTLLLLCDMARAAQRLPWPPLEQASLRGLANGIAELLADYPEALAVIDYGSGPRRVEDER